MRSLHGALPQTIRLRRGCRVIVKRNSRREVKGNTQVVVNGDTGCFLGLDKYDRLCVLLDRTSEICYLKRERIADTRPRVELKEDGSPCVRDQVLGTLEQYPVDLGYAMTIHASQGSTLQRVHLCLPRARPFTPNMLYVALSRAPSLSRITLSRPITDRDIVSTVRGEAHHQQYDLNDD